VAVSISTIWEARAATGNDNNGGGFVAGSGGTDRSQQNSAQVVIDNSAITTSITTNVITFTAGYTPTSADVGNLVQMLTGTNVTAGWYNITAQTATTWTVNGNIVTSGTTTNATGNMGGALATLAKLAGAMLASNEAFVTGAFTSTATTTFAQAATPTGAVPYTRIIGYGASRRDGTHATLTLSTNTGLTGINLTGNGIEIEGIDVNCSSLGTSVGINTGTGTYNLIHHCKVSNFTTAGIYLQNASATVCDCEITGGTAAATAALDLTATGTWAWRNYIHDNACPGILTMSSCLVAFNVVANNTGATTDGVSVSFNCAVLNNTIHGSGRHGIVCTSAAIINNHWKNNLLSSNGGFGWVSSTGGSAGPAAFEYDGNGFYNNTSGTRSLGDSTAGLFGVNPYVNVHDVILTASPYVGPTTGGTANFGLNNAAGGGAAARGAGSPGAVPGLTATVGALDLGASQHQDAWGPSHTLVVRGDRYPAY
jgi:hypothetical protein